MFGARVLTYAKTVRMVDVQKAIFGFQNNCVRMVDVAYTWFVIWNGSLNMVDIWYAYFDMQGRDVKTV